MTRRGVIARSEATKQSGSSRIPGAPMERRGFVQQLAASACGAALPGLFRPDGLEIIRRASSRVTGTAEEAATDEEFWREIQQAFSINRSIVNLDNGNVCPSPR